MNAQSSDKLLISFRATVISYVFEVRMLTNNFIFLISPSYQIKRISSKDSIQLWVDYRIDFFRKILFEDLRDEVYHSLKKILVLKNKPRFSMSQQNTHISIADLFAFRLQLVGFMNHQSPWFKLTVSCKNSIFCLIFFQHSHILKDCSEEMRKEFGF